METVQAQINLETKAKERPATLSPGKRHNPGLRALLSVKHFTATLEKDYSELQQIEKELQQINTNAILIIDANASPEVAGMWKRVLPEINKVASRINASLAATKEKIELNEKDGYPGLWHQLALQVAAFIDNSKTAARTGLMILPESAHLQWEKEFVKLQTPLVEAFVTHVESCRVMLQMIERYTPDQLNTITQIIADHVPLDFTYEEALEYQNDYYKALVNFKKEFKKEKNLWDKFLDILAGGTHQSPSERVMMERWLDGDKGDL